jgi:hypothetical protein
MLEPVFTAPLRRETLLKTSQKCSRTPSMLRFFRRFCLVSHLNLHCDPVLILIPVKLDA